MPMPARNKGRSLHLRVHRRIYQIFRMPNGLTLPGTAGLHQQPVLQPLHFAALRFQRQLPTRGPRRLVPVPERFHGECCRRVRLAVRRHLLRAQCPVYHLLQRTDVRLSRRHGRKSSCRRAVLSFSLHFQLSVSSPRTGVRPRQVRRHLRPPELRVQCQVRFCQKSMYLRTGLCRRSHLGLHATHTASNLFSRLWSKQPLRLRETEQVRM